MRLLTLAAGVVAARAALHLETCGTSGDNTTTFTFAADGTIRTNGGSLCVVNIGNTTLSVAACDPSNPAQQWSYNSSSYTVQSSAPGWCVAFNDQSSSSTMVPGSRTALWTCTELSFNSYFTRDVPYAGALQANYSAADNTTMSNLCVSWATPPQVPPTPDQLSWLEGEIGAFVHFQMATMAGTQGCGDATQAPPDISIWNPSALDTDEWVATAVSMGAVRVVYTAKHGCGFLAWNSTSVPGYNYSTAFAPNGGGKDVVASFIASARKYGVGAGFYYSVVSNAYARVSGGEVQPGGGNTPGQLNLTQSQYDLLVAAHMIELFSQYGPLAEFWLDGGYSASLAEVLPALFEMQPHIVAFQGGGVMPSPVRWVGAESGFAPYPCWSNCDYDSYGAGDPDSPYFNPAETDFTLQNGDNWFYSGTVGVRPPAQLRSQYETSVGSNTALIIDIAPFPNGTVPAEQKQAAALLGTYIRGCYGTPTAQTQGNGTVFTLSLPTPGSEGGVDRIVIREDQSLGQRIRAYTVTALLQGGGSFVLGTGSSVGNKRIHVLPQGLNASVTGLSLSLDAYTAPPALKGFQVYAGCNALGTQLDAEWVAWGESVGYPYIYGPPTDQQLAAASAAGAGAAAPVVISRPSLRNMRRL